MPAELWQPDAEFYNQNPRSARIRDVCVEVITLLEKVYQYRGRPDAYQRDLLAFYSQLELLDGRLISLGISLAMHPNIILEEADSIQLAEWLASQLEVWTGPSLDFLVDDRRLLEIIECYRIYFDIDPPEEI